jgi:hypothetical protein
VRAVNGTMVIDKGVASSALLFRRCTRALHLNPRALPITLLHLNSTICCCGKGEILMKSIYKIPVPVAARSKA